MYDSEDVVKDWTVFSMDEPDFVGVIPLRLDITVLPDVPWGCLAVKDEVEVL
jgi:hypothetical protein